MPGSLLPSVQPNCTTRAGQGRPRGRRLTEQGGAADRLQRLDRAGDEGRLLLDDGVVDRGAEAFVEDLDPEELGTGGGAVLVGAGDGDVEGQDLVGVPGQGGFFEALSMGRAVFLFDTRRSVL